MNPEARELVVVGLDDVGADLGVGIDGQHVHLMPPVRELDAGVTSQDLGSTRVAGQELVHDEKDAHAQTPTRIERRAGSTCPSGCSTGCGRMRASMRESSALSNEALS